MNEFPLMLGVFAGLLLWLAWRERRGDNGRDAKLLAGFGTFVGLGALLAELL